MGIFWAIIALTTLGVITALIGWIQDRNNKQNSSDLDTDDENCTQPNHSGGCCGMHLTCERDSLLAALSPKIVYYDDEELDSYLGIDSHNYTAEATNAFREVLITLNEDDVAGWVRSLQLRGLQIPEELKPEIFLIVEENRAFHMEYGPQAKR